MEINNNPALWMTALTVAIVMAKPTYGYARYYYFKWKRHRNEKHVGLLTGMAINEVTKSSERSLAEAFKGKITEKIPLNMNGSDSSKSFLILVKGSDGRFYSWRAPEAADNSYQIGDYAVKISGKPLPAIFRNGKQLREGAFYLNEEVNRSGRKP